MARITQELRESMNPCVSIDWLTILRSEFESIADRIDEAHKSALASAYGEGAESVALPNLTGYIKLPVDADGVPIHIGDVMAYEDNTKPKEVVALVPPSIFMVEDGPRLADSCRHYHAPTVEDLLMDLLSEAEHFHSLEEERDAISDYASRLRLAGDAE